VVDHLARQDEGVGAGGVVGAGEVHEDIEGEGGLRGLALPLGPAAREVRQVAGGLLEDGGVHGQAPAMDLAQPPVGVGGDPGRGLGGGPEAEAPVLVAILEQRLHGPLAGVLHVLGERDGEGPGQPPQRHQGHQAAGELLGAAVGVLHELLQPRRQPRHRRRRHGQVQAPHVPADRAQVRHRLQRRSFGFSIQRRGLQGHGALRRQRRLRGVPQAVAPLQPEGQLPGAHAPRLHREGHPLRRPGLQPQLLRGVRRRLEALGLQVDGHVEGGGGVVGGDGGRLEAVAGADRLGDHRADLQRQLCRHRRLGAAKVIRPADGDGHDPVGGEAVGELEGGPGAALPRRSPAWAGTAASPGSRSAARLRGVAHGGPPDAAHRRAGPEPAAAQAGRPGRSSQPRSERVSRGRTRCSAPGVEHRDQLRHLVVR
jgi:hypothetical protein